MNKTQNGSGASNLKQDHYIKPEDKVLDYLKRADKIIDIHCNFLRGDPLDITWHIEIAKMIQLEEHREDK